MLPRLHDGVKITADDYWNPMVDDINANSARSSDVNRNTSNIATNATDINTLNSDVTVLNTAVGIPYQNGVNLDTRVSIIEQNGGGAGGTGNGITVVNTISERDALTPHAGLVCYVLDDDTEYVYTSQSQWRILSPVLGPWQDIIMESGFSSFYDRCQVRRSGNLVYMRGGIQSADGSALPYNTPIAQVPSGFEPATAPASFAGAASITGSRTTPTMHLDVQTNGIIVVYDQDPGGLSYWIGVDGNTYWLD